MTDKTLGAYQRTTPDPDETTGEALARLQAEMTRLLDEADAELRDEADGGVAAALIEKEAERSLTFAEGLGEASINAHQAREAEKDAEHFRDRCAELEHRLHLAVVASDHNSERAEKAERERDEARGALRARLGMSAQPRPLTPDAITDEARDRAYRAVAALSVSDWDDMSGVAKGRAMALVETVITEITRPEPPARPEGAKDVAVRLFQAGMAVGVHMTAEQRDELADHLAAMHVRVVTENEDPR